MTLKITNYVRMKTKVLISAMSIFTTFFACNQLEIRYDNIPDEKKPNLQNKNYVCFVNQQDNSIIDTFMIVRNDNYLMYDRYNILEKIVVSYINTDKHSDLKQIDIHFLGSHRFAVYDCVTSNNYKTFEIEIDNVTYSVFAVKNKNPQRNSLPDSMYYSYKEGILRYFHSDTIYNRTSIF
jgi:hypothetical protein